MEPAQATSDYNKHSYGDYVNDIINWFEDISNNAGWVQSKTLRKILELNNEAEYLKKWLGDVKIHELEDSALESLYTSLVPLASHADLEPYIQRIAEGDTAPLLSQQPITTLSLRQEPTFSFSFYFVSFLVFHCFTYTELFFIAMEKHIFIVL